MSRLERNYKPIGEVAGRPRTFSKRTILVDFGALPRLETDQSVDALHDTLHVNLGALNRRAGISQIGNVEISTGGLKPPTVLHSHGDIYEAEIGERKEDSEPTAILNKVGNNLHIHLNTEEIKARLEERGRKMQPASWAHDLNHTIELAFLRHQMDQIQKPLNTYLTAGPHALEGVQALLGQYSGTAHILTELGINAGVMALHNAVPLADKIQSFPLERTVLTSIVSGKGALLGGQAIMRALPKK